MDGGGGIISFYDSAMHRPVFRVTTRPLFKFLDESIKHGWPSFRVEDVVWENVRILEDREVVTIDGLHLGHNIPDAKGPRFCINLVCVSGFPAEERASSIVDGDEEGMLR
jgi:peptide methionine sulfoxide reductase MsrB